jgi:hypothetical protein
MQSLILCLACLSVAQLGWAASIKIGGATVTIEEADGSDGDSASVGFKDKLKTVPKLDHTQKLKVSRLSSMDENHVLFNTLCTHSFADFQHVQVSFSPLDSGGKAIQPEQALLRLTSVVSGKTAFFRAGKLQGDKVEIIATSSGIEDQMGTQGGVFDTLLIVGSSTPAAAIQWAFGQVDILHRPTPDGNQPPARNTRMESAIAVKPEIVHQHRVPEKRAPVIVSLIFTIIILIPLAAFVIVANHLGATPTVSTFGFNWIGYFCIYIFLYVVEVYSKYLTTHSFLPCLNLNNCRRSQKLEVPVSMR